MPASQVRTCDGGYATVGAEVHFSIKDVVLSKTAVQDLNPVSYTHLTLPTNREV